MSDYGYNPKHYIGTCRRCGGEMVYNVPRFGAHGGFIHQESGRFLCADQCKPVTVTITTDPALAQKKQELVDRITGYLSAGGLFNPEMMEHDKVQALLIEVRDYLASS